MRNSWGLTLERHSATENRRTIDRAIFNGIFAFENDSTNLQNENLLDVLNGAAGIVNHICLGKYQKHLEICFTLLKTQKKHIELEQ